jgi:Phytanoyl-CoA dioxygenase (PhyH)
MHHRSMNVYRRRLTPEQRRWQIKRELEMLQRLFRTSEQKPSEVPIKQPDEVARYRRDGFVVIRELCAPSTLRVLRTAYDDLLIAAAGTASYNLMAGAVPHIQRPSLLHDAFRANAAIDNGKIRAASLLGAPRAKVCFDLLIYKEPGNLTETAWHQDHAYSEGGETPANRMPHPYSTVQMWIALDDVDAENGCMHFIPGCQYTETLLHEWVPAGSALQIRNDERATLDFSRVIACPLQAGDATAHGPNTPHFTTGNRSHSRPRRAYIITFAPDYD